MTVEAALTRRDVSDLTVIFPGGWPERVWRGGTRHNVRVRLVSADYHLWVDRLKQHDQAGELDGGAREKLVNRLAGKISADDEKRYTPPSLHLVHGAMPHAEEARKALLADPADPSAGLTVLFGPGGIGKSFFLRRVCARLARQAIKDPTVGIPVYAELPLLLHTDALETWLSTQGIRLPLETIRVLIEEGVITPVLDALDELVRGQAREGSRQFLIHLRETMGASARGVLSCRDYYLNLDPLVPSELGDSPAYLTVGFFDKRGRRRYIQVRADLYGEDAARWANQLESQAAEALAGANQDDVEALIGHPLFLDAFCQMIVDIPQGRRSAAVDGFQLRSPDIFGEIVQQVLEREHAEKFLPGWKSRGFDRQLAGPWKDPFTPQVQRRILRELVLKAAYDGGVEALRRGVDDRRYRRLRHGLFAFSLPSSDSGVADPTSVLGHVIEEVLGEPQAEAHVPEAEIEGLRAHAIEDIVDAIRSHTLSDTQPDQPESLVFATRHRAYFDYLLAEAVLEELISSLRRGAGGVDEGFVLWCLDHNIIEHGEQGEAPAFASCLDFVLWHPDAAETAVTAAEKYLSLPPEAPGFSEELASYICSLGLAMLLRQGQRRGRADLIGLDVASQRDCSVRILPDIVPTASRLSLESCMFPKLVLRDLDLSDISIIDTEFQALEIGESVWRQVTMSIEAEALSFHGRVDLQDCILDIRGAAAIGAEIEWAPTTKVTLRKCHLSADLYDRLHEQAKVSGGSLQLEDCQPILKSETALYSPGRKFVNRLMNLCRKHGHNEYGVYSAKLRGRSLATSATFSEALAVLAKRGVIVSANDEVVKLTPLAESERFSGKAAPGQRTYDEVADFWTQTVEDLDKIFTGRH